MWFEPWRPGAQVDAYYYVITYNYTIAFRHVISPPTNGNRIDPLSENLLKYRRCEATPVSFARVLERLAMSG
jgi:hypothetical protein